MPRTPESSNVVSVCHMAEIKWWSVAEQGEVVCPCTPPFCHLVCMTRQEKGGSLQAPNHLSIYVKVCTIQRSNIVEMSEPPASLIVEVASRLSITLSPSVAWTTWVCPCTTTRQPVACTHMGWLCIMMYDHAFPNIHCIYNVCFFGPSIVLQSMQTAESARKLKISCRNAASVHVLLICFLQKSSLWDFDCRDNCCTPCFASLIPSAGQRAPRSRPSLLALPRSRKQHWQRAEGILLDRVSQIRSKSDCTSTTSALHTRTTSQCWSVFHYFVRWEYFAQL